MKTDSAVEFGTTSRIHMGLAVKSLERSMAFYSTLFGQEPTKVRPHYARFEVAEPPVNLSLNEIGCKTGPNNPIAHFGIQVKTTQAVKQIAARLAVAGFETTAEENVSCCYAVQSKVWAVDPDGNKWEAYLVLDDVTMLNHSTNACCPGVPGIVEAVERGDLVAAKSAFDKAGGMAACSCLTNDVR
jgi:catechol 2,3-dioxygenase-like lactoylglutathione lyase family enzyme